MKSSISTSSKILYRVLSRIYKNLQQLHPSRVYTRIRRFMRSRSNKKALTTLKLMSQGHSVRTSAQKTIVSKQLAQLLVGLLVLSGPLIYVNWEKIKELVDVVARSIRNVLERQVILEVLMKPIMKLLGRNMEEKSLVKYESRQGNVPGDELELNLPGDEPSNKEAIISHMINIYKHIEQLEKYRNELDKMYNGILKLFLKRYDHNNNKDLKQLSQIIDDVFTNVFYQAEMFVNHVKFIYNQASNLHVDVQNLLNGIIKYKDIIQDRPIIPCNLIKILGDIKSNYSILKQYEDEKRDDKITDFLYTLKKYSFSCTKDIEYMCVCEIRNLFMLWGSYYLKLIRIQNDNKLKDDLKQRYISDTKYNINKINRGIEYIFQELLNDDFTLFKLIDSYVHVITLINDVTFDQVNLIYEKTVAQEKPIHTIVEKVVTQIVEGVAQAPTSDVEDLSFSDGE